MKNADGVEIITEYNLIEISLVDKCPYCGSKDWVNPGTMRNGEACNHPTKLKQGFNSTMGTKGK